MGTKQQEREQDGTEGSPAGNHRCRATGSGDESNDTRTESERSGRFHDRHPAQAPGGLSDIEHVEHRYDPPTNDKSEFVCGRTCVDGSRCAVRVSLPYMACHQHDRSDPISRGNEEPHI